MNNNIHSLRRTSPKGQDFIGVCVKCGKEGLTFDDMKNEECPNVRGTNQNEDLLEALAPQEQT